MLKGLILVFSLKSRQTKRFAFFLLPFLFKLVFFFDYNKNLFSFFQKTMFFRGQDFKNKNSEN